VDCHSRYPAQIVVDAAALLPPGRALDLACGSGRNARYLAQLGWRVIAVDLSTAAVQMVRGVLADLERNAVPFRDQSFDLVCVIHFLHRPLFDEVRRLVKPGGVVVSAIHTVRSTMNPLYTVEIGELRSYFADWQVLIDREDQIAELVARKPMGSGL
jgi:SAM-dependent methyltransferase